MNPFVEGQGSECKSSVQRKPLEAKSDDSADALAARVATEVEAWSEPLVKSEEKQSLKATITRVKCMRLALSPIRSKTESATKPNATF